MKEYQITLFDATGAHKPVSCIVKTDATITRDNAQEISKDLRTQGIKKICIKRGWSSKDLKRYGYTKVKMREYNKEKIAQENAERYEQIKKERGWS